MKKVIVAMLFIILMVGGISASTSFAKHGDNDENTGPQLLVYQALIGWIQDAGGEWPLMDKFLDILFGGGFDTEQGQDFIDDEEVIILNEWNDVG